MFGDQPRDEQGKSNPVFGRKFNLIGGVFLAALLLLAVYRHITLDKPFGMVEEETPQMEEAVDSLLVE
jgi:hypothetical protein